LCFLTHGRTHNQNVRDMKILLSITAIMVTGWSCWIVCRQLPTIRRWMLTNLRRSIFWLDSFLKRSQKIYEFSSKDECLLRLSLVNSHRDMQLADGTKIFKGDCVAELHFWNEHFPSMPQNGADLAWAAAFKRLMIQSLHELAAFIEQDPQMEKVNAFYGDTTIGSHRDFPSFSLQARRWGFEVTTQSDKDSIRRRLSELFKNIYTTGLIWAFNPENLNGNKLWTVRRDYIWISRQTLVERYGAKPDRSGPPLKHPKLASRQISPKSNSPSIGRTKHGPAFQVQPEVLTASAESRD